MMLLIMTKKSPEQSSVEKGENLSDSMRENEEFPSILVDMIKAGEASGSLENSLTRMAIQFEKDAKLKGVVKKAMITLIDESVKSACVSDVDFVGSSSPYATFTSGVFAYFSGFSSNSFLFSHMLR